MVTFVRPVWVVKRSDSNIIDNPIYYVMGFYLTPSKTFTLSAPSRLIREICSVHLHELSSPGPLFIFGSLCFLVTWNLGEIREVCLTIRFPL